MSQYKIEPSRIRSLPASSKAFSSACMHRHVESPTPPPCAPLHRGPCSCVSFHMNLTMDRLRTTAFVAIPQVSWRAIVPSTNDTLLSDQDTTNTTFHAVASLGCQRCQLHEVLVPIRPQPFFVRQIQDSEGFMQSRERLGGV